MRSPLSVLFAVSVSASLACGYSPCGDVHARIIAPTEGETLEPGEILLAGRVDAEPVWVGWTVDGVDGCREAGEDSGTLDWEAGLASCTVELAEGSHTITLEATYYGDETAVCSAVDTVTFTVEAPEP